MAIDKLLLVSQKPPRDEFIQAVNEDLLEFGMKRNFRITWKHVEDDHVHRTSRCRIATNKGAVRPFTVNLNFGRYSRTLLEVNPSRFPEGFLDLQRVVRMVFGAIRQDIGITRIDLYGDISVPVDYLRRTLRIPNKRKGLQFIPIEMNRGVSGFYIGKNPKLRVYDKREEMKSRRKKKKLPLPKILTRVEWEFRRDKCPIKRLAELPALLGYNPFTSLQFIECEELYDFRIDPKGSLKRFVLNKLREEMGAQEAVRILNLSRNFWRDYRELVVDRSDIGKQLHRAYLQGLQRFFGNKPPLIGGTMMQAAHQI